MPTVLVIDDDEDDRMILEEAMYEINPLIECLKSNNGATILAELKTSLTPLPDVIFLDWNMPRMNGLECLKELKKDDNLKNIPVVIYTSEPEEDLAMKYGASYLVTKIPDYRQLCENLKVVLDCELLKIASRKS